MNQLTTERTPVVIATEINSIKGQTQAMVLHASAEIGKRLIEAKELLPHGEWGGWLKENIDYSQSTANNLMQLYREYGANSEALGNLSYTKALALLGVPEEDREKFVQENDVENMSARELQKVVKEKQKLEKQLAKQENEALKEKAALAKQIVELEKRIEESSSEDDKVSELIAELEDAKAKVKRLESDLKAKPIDAATVEVVPPEIEEELRLLRQQVSEKGDSSILKFRVRFESLVTEFRNTLEALDGISEETEKEKYKQAMVGLIDKMQQRL